MSAETCFVCDDETGRAGRGEDSIYCGACDQGPFCSACWDKHEHNDEGTASEQQHTPDPWVADGRYVGTTRHRSLVCECYDRNHNWSDDGFSRANAERIVACVNACAGLSDDDLERLAKGDTPSKAFERGWAGATALNTGAVAALVEAASDLLAHIHEVDVGMYDTPDGAEFCVARAVELEREGALIAALAPFRKAVGGVSEIEHCAICDEPTGHAGRGDDSLYCDTCGRGPYCDSCWDEHIHNIDDECGEEVAE